MMLPEWATALGYREAQSPPSAHRCDGVILVAQEDNETVFLYCDHCSQIWLTGCGGRHRSDAEIVRNTEMRYSAQSVQAVCGVGIWTTVTR